MKDIINLTKFFKKSKKNKKNKDIKSTNIDNKQNNLESTEDILLLEKLELEKAMFLRSTRRKIEKTYYDDLLK